MNRAARRRARQLEWARAFAGPRSRQPQRPPAPAAPTLPVLALEPGGARLAALRARAELFRPTVRVRVTPSVLSAARVPTELEAHEQRVGPYRLLFLLEDWMEGRAGAMLSDDGDAIVRWAPFAEHADADGRFAGSLEVLPLQHNGVT